MPRKPRKPRKAIRPVLTDSLKQYLQTGNYLTRETFPNCPGRAITFMLAHPGRRAELRRAWKAHKAEILSGWKKNRVLPWAAKLFD